MGYDVSIRARQSRLRKIAVHLRLVAWAVSLEDFQAREGWHDALSEEAPYPGVLSRCRSTLLLCVPGEGRVLVDAVQQVISHLPDSPVLEHLSLAEKLA